MMEFRDCFDCVFKTSLSLPENPVKTSTLHLILLNKESRLSQEPLEVSSFLLPLAHN